MTDQTEAPPASIPPEQSIKANSMGDLALLLGMDTARLWVTGAQVFVNPDHCLLILKEQVSFTGMHNENGETIASTLDRNIGSLVMPLDSARALRDSLNELLPPVNV